ncbi:MAG: flavodoxin domain-containing protein, partial [Litoreibacter sp.]|nr:flavodoxin domain-containing protein [Litoreibacter sp.]MCY4335444.1 flavodoxin domain-containing protein [Litoreibacter sp.]
MNVQTPLISKTIEDAISAAEPQIELLPEGAPFDAEQRQWLNGLLTGLSAIAASAAAEGGEDAAVLTPLKVLYGSQSGNCETLSKDLRKSAGGYGFEAEVIELDDLTPADLAEMQHAVIVVSTFGEGEPPDNAVKFVSALMAEDCPPLPATLNFSVCGLGDTSYADFNQCATDIDARLVELGATRAADLVKCDLDFDDDYAEWKEAVFASEPFVAAAAAGVSAPAVDDEPAPMFDKNRPFMASLLASERLSGQDSAKCVNHIEISLAGGGVDLEYAAGDASGVWPVNCPGEVRAMLDAAGLSGKETVALKSGPAQLRAALTTRLDLATITPKTLEAFGINEAPDGAEALDLVMVAETVEAQQLVDALRPLQPRLYSISSSPKAHPGEVHLTVGEVRYDLNERACKGVASTYLGERLAEGSMVGVYVQKSAHFHPPADDDTPLIMIGPGTGIAPFRAFLEEREARGATGKNWLFFGDQHENCDYLYRESIEKWAESGLLNELSLAWSRDGAEKVYVQTLLEERGEEVFAWLEEGAAIYICGDASRMAVDVEAALLRVIAKGAGTDEAGAKAYLVESGRGAPCCRCGELLFSGGFRPLPVPQSSPWP